VRTCIHHGYRLGPDVDVLAFTRDVARSIEPVYRTLALRAVGRSAATLLAHRRTGRPVGHAVELLSASQVPPDAVGSWAPTLLCQAATIVDLVQHRLSQPLALRVPTEMDLSLRIVFLDDPGPARSGHRYALLHTDRTELVARWEAMPAVEPWPYWDTSVPPGGVTDDEWGERMTTWDRVLEGDPPGYRGLSWTPPASALANEALPIMRSEWLTGAAVAHQVGPIRSHTTRSLAERLAGRPLIDLQPLVRADLN
jgi:hypothetical protein